MCDLLDCVAKYKETYTTAVSTRPAVAMLLLTISSWILIQWKVTGGAVLFQTISVAYCDRFGSVTGNENCWLGLNKVYLMIQLCSITLKVEVTVQ